MAVWLALNVGSSPGLSVELLFRKEGHGNALRQPRVIASDEWQLIAQYCPCHARRRSILRNGIVPAHALGTRIGLRLSHVPHINPRLGSSGL
jgi:hypothetical protein